MYTPALLYIDIVGTALKHAVVGCGATCFLSAVALKLLIFWVVLRHLNLCFSLFLHQGPMTCHTHMCYMTIQLLACLEDTKRPGTAAGSQC